MLKKIMTSIWSKVKKIITNPWFLLSIILVIALVLRFLEIGRTSFWYDEAFTGDTIKLSWKDMFVVIAKDKVHPPLFYIFIRLWAYIFGLTQISLRGFSILWGVSSILLVYLCIRNLFEKSKFPVVSLTTALALSISPFFIAYSNEARSYSFLAFVALALGFVALKWLDTKNKKYLIASILLSLLLCATHYLQIVFVIAVVCTILIYKYIFTSKGLNKKGLYVLIAVLVSTLLGLIFLSPLIRGFLTAHGIGGMWWIPSIKWYEVFRIYYSYFLGVVRYMDGVPPMRDLIINVPKLLIAFILFGIHLSGYIYILASKRFTIEVKRHISFFFLLGIITFIGFYILSVIGFNSFVERYTIAGGITIFVSFWMIMSTIFTNWYLIIPVGIYVASTFLLTNMPLRIDYRNIAKELDTIEDTNRYIFSSPTDLIDSEFYMSHSNVYYAYDFKGEFPGWALLEDDVNGVYINDVSSGDLLIVPNSDVQKYLDMGFNTYFTLSEGLTVMRK